MESQNSENQQELAYSMVDLRLSSQNSFFGNEDDGKILLKDFDLEQNEHFIKFVFIPYFKDIYNDLAEKSEKKAKGINKIVFTEVSFKLVVIICLVR